MEYKDGAISPYSCFAFGQEIETRDMDMELCKREMCTWLMNNNCLLLHITTE